MLVEGKNRGAIRTLRRRDGLQDSHIPEGDGGLVAVWL